MESVEVKGEKWEREDGWELMWGWREEKQRGAAGSECEGMIERGVWRGIYLVVLCMLQEWKTKRSEERERDEKKEKEGGAKVSISP